MAPVLSGEQTSHQPLMTDSGFRGADGLQHGSEVYGVQVYPLPKPASRAARRQWRAARRGVEAPFSSLTESFGRKYPGAPTS